MFPKCFKADFNRSASSELLKVAGKLAKIEVKRKKNGQILKSLSFFQVTLQQTHKYFLRHTILSLFIGQLKSLQKVTEQRPHSERSISSWPRSLKTIDVFPQEIDVMHGTIKQFRIITEIYGNKNRFKLIYPKRKDKKS